MLRQAFEINGSSVHVYRKRGSVECKVAVDFELGNLYFVWLENELWEVGCLDKGKFLIFDDLRLLKIE
jgi:hypothetical protein